jgi:predicted transcriptional regulator
MDDIVRVLQRLGFGEYEAKAYIALLQRSPLTGYELAKQSGLPRANVYTLLPKLEERGAVVRLDTPSGPRYAPVPPVELAQRLGSRFQDDLDEARRSLEQISAPAEYEYIWNTRGHDVVLDNARALLEAAQETLLIAIWPQESLALKEELAAAEGRGVAITTLCLPACPRECGGCQGGIYRFRVGPEYGSRWLLVVEDGVEMLAAEIGTGDEALAVRTRQRLFVELTAWYIRHSIALSTVVRDLGERLPDLLSPQAASVLEAIGPGGPTAGWLEFMRHAVGRESAIVDLLEGGEKS